LVLQADPGDSDRKSFQDALGMCFQCKTESDGLHNPEPHLQSNDTKIEPSSEHALDNASEDDFDQEIPSLS
jgi:hypothetical protein